MSRFIDDIIISAQTNVQRIVLPEGGDPRTIEAARLIASRGIAKVIILGDPAAIQVDGVTVIDHRTSPERDRYAAKLAEIRANKGMTLAEAYAALDDELTYGVMMVKTGDADGMTSGACHATSDVIRPALQILKCAPGMSSVSSFFEMTVPDCTLGEGGTFFFADCGLNTYPDAAGLAQIAMATARSWRTFMGTTPRVAMLSFSTKGSGKGGSVDLVRDAVSIVRNTDPELLIDGELQLDAAIVPEVAELKAPDSPVAGHANILVFPDIDAGNIGYKLVQRLARAEAIGPILQGLAAPVNDLSRGCTPEDIVGAVAITAAQAQRLHQERPY